MERIESAENPKIKQAAALHMRKERERRGEFIAEGVRLTEEAAAASWPLLFCLVTEETLQNERVQAIVAVLEKKRCPVGNRLMNKTNSINAATANGKFL